MKKRGFTLVELLAVIVILAIIALIAVPVFLGIINNTKKSSDKEGVNLYTDTVEKAIQKKQMSDPNFMPDKCTIKTDGNLECFSGTTSLGTVKVSMKGTKPTSGTIYITEDDVTYENIVLNGKIYYENEIATLVNDASPTGVSIGDKYTYKVNDGDTFNFYVLSIEGDKVNLIMDRNICEDGKEATESNKCLTSWYSFKDQNIGGPITAMTYLYKATKNWNNVPDMVMNYIDENNSNEISKGYKSIITSNGVTTIKGKAGSDDFIIDSSPKPLKARLPKLSEVNGAGCTESSGSCPSWLVEYMSDTTTPSANSIYPNNELVLGIYGYWLLPSSTNVKSAFIIEYNGYFSDRTTGSGYGIRPVITVNISDLK